MVSDETRRMLLTAVAACDDKKGEDTKILELDEADAGLADYFLITSATNDRQAVAIADEIELRLKKEFGVYAKSVEGRRQAEWILLDYVDIVIHVFLAEKRAFYDIERLRKSARQLSSAEVAEELKAAMVSRTKAVRKSSASKKNAVTKTAPGKRIGAAKSKAGGEQTVSAETAKKSAKKAVKKAAAKKAAPKKVAAKKAPAKKAAAKPAAKKAVAKKAPAKKAAAKPAAKKAVAKKAAPKPAAKKAVAKKAAAKPAAKKVVAKKAAAKPAVKKAVAKKPAAKKGAVAPASLGMKPPVTQVKMVGATAPTLGMKPPITSAAAPEGLAIAASAAPAKKASKKK